MQWSSFIKLVAIAAVLWPVVTQAQTYPSRPIVMVVPFAAGGTFDVMGRIMASRMSELLGQQVIVENTTGAGGIIGVNRVVNAAPDGYTILLGSTGTHAYNQTIYKKRRYDAVNDFTPVTLWSEQPMVLETRKDLPANTIPEFAALLKANGAKMQYGSAGAGSTTHLACSLLNASDRRQRHARSVSRLGARLERSDRRADRLPVRQSRRGGAAHHRQAGEGDRGAVEGTLAADAGACERARAGAQGFRHHHLDRVFPAQGHAEGDRRQAQRGHARDDGDAGDQEADAGDRRDRRRARAAKRRNISPSSSPTEIARWEGPIKSMPGCRWIDADIARCPLLALSGHR